MKHKIEYFDFYKADEVYNFFHKHMNQINLYVDQLRWWNKKINLVSRDVSRETLLNHALHSLAITQSDLFKSNQLIIDAGTGGGLPGFPLALTHPQKEFILNDIVIKKMMVCKQIITSLELINTQCNTGSIMDLQWNNDAILITKHAFKINDLYKMVHFKNWSGLIMLKGAAEVENELSGINDILHIHIYNLYPAFKSTFFEGKAMVEITKDK